MHQRGICHRDIKPDNLLVHESGSLRISDFGCAEQYDLTSNPPCKVSNTSGSLAFWPPEAIAPPVDEADFDDLPPMPGQEGEGGAEGDEGQVKMFSALGADMWAAGMTLHCFLYGCLPFPINHSSLLGVMESIRTYTPSPLAPPSVIQQRGAEQEGRWREKEDVQEAWRALLSPEASRWSATEVLERSRWVQSEERRREVTPSVKVGEEEESPRIDNIDASA